MKSYLNIDKSAFHKGDYVGYSDGAWHIRRNSRGHLWGATKCVGTAPTIYAKTLGDISDALTARAAL